MLRWKVLGNITLHYITL